MFHKTGVVLCFSVMILPFNLFQTAKPGNREFTLQRKHAYAYTSSHSAPVLIVLQGQSPTAEKQKLGPSEKDATATGKEKDTSPPQSKKKAPSKGFVPSEKIKADKAVDFPADI